LNCRAGKAAAALHAYDAKATAANGLLADAFSLFADITSVVADWGNIPTLSLDIVGSLVPHILHTVADFVAYNGGTVSPVLQGLLAAGDALAGVANVIKGFAIFSFSVSGVIKQFASFAEQSVKELVISVISSFGSAGASFVGMSQDAINLQDYNIDHVWSPQRIINQCQSAHLSSCG
jgi:hypothetical protein